jgi:predicted CDP-diglyceride synthetase/phosphatidate cytidylyltransferase
MGGEINSVITLSIVSQISTCKVWLEVQKVNNRIANYWKLVITLSVVNKLSKIIVLDLTQITH